MAELKNHQVDGWLKEPGTTHLLVLVYGPDRGLVSERAAAFARATNLDLDDAFAVTRIDGSSAEEGAGRMVEEARTVSMFGGRRLIWVRSAPGTTAFVNAVADLLEDPPAETVVLIESGELKKASKLRSTVEKSELAMALPSYSDDTRALDRLIDSELAAAGKTIEMDARQLLKRSLGGDRIASRNEIEKLLLYCESNDRVTGEDVAASVGDAAGLSQDEIVDALLSGAPGQLDIAYSRQVRSGSPAFLSAATVIRQFQAIQLMRASVEFDRKTPGSAVATARPPVFFNRRKLVENAVAAMDLHLIERGLGRLHDAVLRSRTYPDLAVSIIRQALLAITLEIGAAYRRH